MVPGRYSGKPLYADTAADMKVLDLRCSNGHAFEGWFGSEEDFLQQNGSARIECPMCADSVITRLLSAPRLNISGARAPVVPATESREVATSVDAPGVTTTVLPANMPVPAEMQAMWLRAVHHVMANTEDVGRRFAEEARRIHYGETPERAIRGAATPEERMALQEEGIDVMSLPLPHALKGSIQ